MSELVFLPAYQLAQMISNRTVSASEILESYLSRIAKFNGKVNAICTIDEENARKQAKQADEALFRGENWGILHGVPITIKDTLETAGLRTTAGYQVLREYIPQEDATTVARLRAAGAIILGKSNPAKLAGDFQSRNDLFERANNPWDFNYTTGGSSGGSAAAIAFGFSSLDLGSDIAGSIRQPCHFCGIYGLKPTDRRVSTAGHIPELPGMPHVIRHMLVIGPIARSIEDLQLAFSLIADADSRRLDIPPVPLDTSDLRKLQELKIAWVDVLEWYPVAQSIQLAIQTVAEKLEKAGTKIEQWPAKFDFLAAWRVYFTLSAYLAPLIRPFSLDYVRESLTLMLGEMTQGEPTFRNISSTAKTVFSAFLNSNMNGYFEALTQRDQLITQMEEALAQWDVLICPVSGTPAFTHCPPGSAIDIDGRSVPYLMASGAYTIPFSFTGHPAVVIPIEYTLEGLPIGMQIVGKRWREMELLAIAKEINQLVGDFRHPKDF